ncbi:MAG: GntR family transcriptional regulator [Anaerolineales bacterium]|nr:GntR family transcriptional regulator [Anaerolineales bacterium]
MKPKLPFSLDLNSPVPYYFQIEENIRTLIANGQFKPGDMLMPEKAIALELGVSHITVRQALKDLTNEGLLVRRRAIGTFIAPPRRIVPIVRNRLVGLTEEMAEEGIKVTSIVLDQSIILATGELVKELQIPHNERVIRIHRLRFIKDIPLVIETTHHPYERFPKLMDIDTTDQSVYSILKQVYNIQPVESKDYFVADIASKDIAELLNIDVGAPIMRYKRTAKDETGQVMEYTISIYRADLYQFVIYYQSESPGNAQGGEMS